MDWIVVIMELSLSVCCLVALVYLEARHNKFLKTLPSKLNMAETIVLEITNDIHKKNFLFLASGAVVTLVIAVGTVWLG